MRLLTLVTATALADDFVRGPCYDPETNEAQLCTTPLTDPAKYKHIVASNTCGLDGPEIYYDILSPTKRSAVNRQICDSGENSHGTDALTDDTNENWWQSQTIYASKKAVQYPGNVTLTLDMHKNHQVAWIRIQFKSPRPQAMMIEKYYKGSWTPFQYFSEYCHQYFGKSASENAFPENEDEALCSAKHSGITPSTGGEVVFSVLYGRPSNHNYENSMVLREFSTAEKLRITLVRMHTYGDELYGRTQDLQSYYYAINQIMVGAFCQCHGHARSCNERTGDCECEHNTQGVDCNECKPLYNNKPWSFATSEDAHECEMCECNGKAEACVYDEDLGHGRCVGCKDNTSGPMCDQCAKNHYRDQSTGECVPCACHSEGSTTAQCDANGQCSCQPGVTGEKCDTCMSGYYALDRSGCTPCACDLRGSKDANKCDSITGQCECKDNVEGRRCDQCKAGFMGTNDSNDVERPREDNEFGCTPCFCYEHSNVCHASDNYVKTSIKSTFGESAEGWGTVTGGSGVDYDPVTGRISSNSGFDAPEVYQGPNRFSYNQKLSFDLALKEVIDAVDGGHVSIKGINKYNDVVKVTAPIDLKQTTEKQHFSLPIHEKQFLPESGPALEPREFIELLNAITEIQIHAGPSYLDNVNMETAEPAFESQNPNAEIATWVESCVEPRYTKSSQGCAPGFTRDHSNKDINQVYRGCIECDCNNHSEEPCDTELGFCFCNDNTAGDHCEVCAEGFFGDALKGTPEDCQPCPCPNESSCTLIPVEGSAAPVGATDGLPVICTDCPEGSEGVRCEECKTDYFGDPLGRFGSAVDCQKCQCNSNTILGVEGNCDSLSGECLQCLYNTAGFHCEECAPNHWGNPIASREEQGWKGCKECNCDPVGTVENTECDVQTGQCQCKPGVTGLHCDQCLPEHYNFGQSGCYPCDCDKTGSVHGQCDQNGMCECRNGVMGMQCDRCIPDHYGLDKEGCKPCNCGDGAEMSQCDEEGICMCKEGVVGDKCDSCAENHFDIDAGCKKCDNCYDMVQMVVNQHRDELDRLRRLARETATQPSMISDAEFEAELEKLIQESRQLEDKSKRIVDDYQVMIDDLKQAGHESYDVQQMLREFELKLNECESRVANAKSVQAATDGTIFTMKKSMDQVEQILKEAYDQLVVAEQKADEQADKHKELTGLAARSDNLLDTIRTRSEEVQQQAEQAKETADRARKQINDSLKLIADLKNRLQVVQSNDVKSTVERINGAKKRAVAARDAADQAQKRALDVAQQIKSIQIPNLDRLLGNAGADKFFGDGKTLEEKTDYIQQITGDLENKLDDLQARFNKKVDELQDSYQEAQDEYDEGHKLLNTADKLLAMVHAASQQAGDDNQRIQSLLDKAHYIYEQLSTFNKLNGPDSDNSGRETRDVGDLQKELKAAKDNYEVLSSNIEPLKAQAEQFSQHASEDHKKATDADESVSEYLQKAQELKDEIIRMTETVQQRINDSTDQELRDAVDEKERQIEKLEADSETANQKAVTARKHVEDASEQLERIKELVQNLSDRNLSDLVEQLNSDRRTTEIADSLSAAEKQYQELLAEFEAFKAQQQAQQDAIQKKLHKDEQNMDLLKRKQENLQEELNQLEQIERLLPKWCDQN